MQQPVRHLLAPSVVFVDLETTGANPLVDRIIEIGIVKASEGRLEYEWQTLVNPGTPIPAAIRAVTGISDDMVRDAPAFEDVARELFERLRDSLFVAHNARFDYGFLKQSFRRLGLAFQPQVLCTVKLSRALYPEHHRHGLDALIARHGIACSARHRALGDARALWDFVQVAYAEKPAELLEAALAKALRTPKLPPGLDAGELDGLPEAPGVYVFHGEGDRALYVGRADNLRNRVQGHFGAERSTGMAQEVRRIRWTATAGELGALLEEARLLRSLQPLHNRPRRGEADWCSYRLGAAGHGHPLLELVRAADILPDGVGTLHGLFKGPREAAAALREIAGANQLCHKRLGLEAAAAGACSAQRVKRCRGACVGREDPLQHDLRLRAALVTLKLKTWPYPGPIAVREDQPDTGHAQYHLFDAWCYLGTARDEAELGERLMPCGERSFDADVYRLLTRYLSVRQPRVVHLSRPRVLLQEGA